MGAEVVEDSVTEKESSWLEVSGGVDIVDDVEVEVTRFAIGGVGAVDGAKVVSD